MAEQLGVDREDEQAAAAVAPLRVAAQAGGDRSQELARLALRRGRCGGRVVGAAADPPDPHPAQRFAVELGIGGVRRVAVERPEPGDRLPVDRQRGRAGGGRDRRQGVERLGTWALWSTQNQLDSGLRQGPLETRRVGALGEPEAAVPAEAPAVRADPGVELQPQPGPGRQQRQHRVGGRGGGEGDPARPRRPPERPQRVAAGGVEQLQGALVAGELAAERRAALGRGVAQVRFGGGDPALDGGRRAGARRSPASSSWSARTGVTVIVRSWATSSTGR